MINFLRLLVLKIFKRQGTDLCVFFPVNFRGCFKFDSDVNDVMYFHFIFGIEEPMQKNVYSVV